MKDLTHTRRFNESEEECDFEQSCIDKIDFVKPRESVKWFSEQMESKLRQNDDKGGWGRCSHSWLINRLKQEVEELEKALGGPPDNQKLVIEESADVANFAMMIADLAGNLYGK